MELKEVKLPSGKVAKLKTELSVGDLDDVNAVLYASMDKVSIDDGEKALKEMKIQPGVLVKMKYVAMQGAIVSIQDGEEVHEKLDEKFFRSLSVSDANVLEAECNQLLNAARMTDDEKKGSSSPTSSASTPETQNQ